MSPWDVIKKMKELSAKLAADGATTHPEELSELLGVMALLVETQQHDIQVLRASVARLEHHVRHKQILQ